MSFVWKKVVFSPLLLFVCASISLNAQLLQPFDEVLEQLTAQLHSAHPEDLDEWLHRLFELREHPLDLNNADRLEFDRLFFLSDFQRYSLYQYVRQYNPVLTLYELTAVYGFDRESIEMLAHFVVLQERRRSLQWSDLSRGRHSLMSNASGMLQETRGQQLAFHEGGYEGSPLRLSLRYQYSLYGRVSAGFFADKDPGESFFTGSNPQGFDYYGAYLACQHIGRLSYAVVGRYSLSYGQGLVLGSGLGLYKSSDVFHTGPTSQGIRAYSSLNENNYLQGAATRISLSKALYWDIFASHANKDANLNDKGEISSFYETGYHRTQQEIQKQKNYTEQLLGSSMLYVGRYYSLGLLFVHHDFSRSLNPSSHMHNVYRFRGSDYRLMSLYSKWNFRSLSWYQEIAGNMDAYAVHLGFVAKLSDALGVSCSYRTYSNNYYARYASGFSESDIRNEKGVYVGTQISFPRGLTFTTYADIFQYPWLRYTVKAPSQGTDYFFQLQQKQRRWDAYLRFSDKTKMETERSDNLYRWEEYTRQKFRANLLFMPNGSWRLQSRFEVVRHVFGQEQAEKGMLLLQDFRYTAARMPLQYTFRLAFFDTDSYAARVYAYEADLLYAFAVPSFYGEGTRTFLLIKWRVNTKLQVGMKYGYTLYYVHNTLSHPATVTIGSGLSQTQGPVRSELKVQLIFKP